VGNHDEESEKPGESVRGRYQVSMAAGVSLVSVLIVGLTWMLSANQVARGSEFRFVVEDLPDHSAAWLPSEVVIHTDTDLRDGLIFLLVNPTVRTHVFMVEGLYEQVAGEQGDVINKPLRVTVAPEGQRQNPGESCAMGREP
jgi:hypothetical protein